AMGAVEFLFLWRVLPGEAAPSSPRPINIRSFLLMATSLSCITLGATCSFLHPAVRLLLPCGLALLAVYVRYEWYSDNPLLNFRVLALVPGLPVGMTATFINYGSFMGLSVLFSLYLQQILGLNAFEAGMVLMTQSMTQVLFAPVAGRLADKYEPTRVYRCGMTLVGVSILSFAWLNAASPVWMVVLMMGSLGFGVAFFVAPCMSATLGNVPREHLPIATGLLGCLRTLGGLMCHILVSVMLGLFLGDAEIGAENNAAFLRCMRWAVIFFGIMNLSGMFFTTRLSRRT
ncbi:MAG: MFS transporter, partial [Mailhella sp.]|nr:MFS transporter [Mailhella sp.]